MTPAGYAHPDYVDALKFAGTPHDLSACGGAILERNIPNSEHVDATGCYPFFVCRDWQALRDDLDALSERCVSLALVTDPLGDWTPQLLGECFPDVCKPFKTHYLVDLPTLENSQLSSHHRRNARKGLKQVEVELCDPPQAWVEAWSQLYDVLIARHEIEGIAAFSRASFEQQLRVPGARLYRAEAGGEVVGMVLWYVQGDDAYYHLGAYTPAGYDMNASFAIFSRSIEQMRDAGLRRLCLGGGAGASKASEGLVRFKRGWSNQTCEVYFCGRIFQPDVYRALTEAAGTGESAYFPAYRDPGA